LGYLWKAVSPTEDKLLVRLRAADEFWKLNVEAQIEDVRRMRKERKAG
jgi:hypothetical protein